MPANRSRTERWRDCLQQIYERNGGLEVAVTRPEASGGVDLVWRVRILGLSEQEIVLEQPSALNQSVPLGEGTPLTCAMSIGQNRWMFTSRVKCKVRVPARVGLGLPGVVIQMPDKVERCARRSFLRVATASLNLPEVECWPLLDPTTAMVAEEANRTAIESLRAGPATGLSAVAAAALPEVGPGFKARLLNVGGGGAGLLVNKSDSGVVDGSRLYWFRVNLTPEVPLPLGVTGRMVHTHMDHEQNVYAGIAFEFAMNPSHKDFVGAQIARFSEAVQQITARAA